MTPRAWSECGDGRPDGEPNASASELPEVLSMVLSMLSNPASCNGLTVQQWDRVFPFANHIQLLPQLAARIRETDHWNRIPETVRSRLESECLMSRLNTTSMRFELDQLERTLHGVEGLVVLLKGAAYLRAGFPWAAGRRTTDVDLLVSEDRVSSFELAMRSAGYGSDEELTPADTRYYRRWLHELAPLQHGYRKIEVDVHFRLLPMADRRTFATNDQLGRSVPIEGSRFRILDPVDRVLHSILNLARIGDFRRAIRDLWDLRCLVEGLPWERMATNDRDHAFEWDDLIKRSKALQLEDSAAYVLLLAEELVQLRFTSQHCQALTGKEKSALRRKPLYRLMRTAALPDEDALYATRRRTAIWAMEHYPLPKVRTWLDPLTWTKRLHFLQDAQ